ncbi:hypothetical protein YC2023_050224 [Brassica napus]
MIRTPSWKWSKNYQLASDEADLESQEPEIRKKMLQDDQNYVWKLSAGSEGRQTHCYIEEQYLFIV